MRVVAIPQACSPPMLTLSVAKVRPPPAGTGAVPNPYPQQYMVPPGTRPHVCFVAVPIEVNVSPPTTATGAKRWSVVLSPRLPKALRPQQYAAPLVVRAQLYSDPALTAAKVALLATAEGVETLPALPFPSSP